MKYNDNRLNILDAENKTLTLKNPIKLEEEGNYSYILFFLFLEFKFFA